MTIQSGSNTDVAAFDTFAAAQTAEAASRQAEAIARVAAFDDARWSTAILRHVPALPWPVGPQT